MADSIERQTLRVLENLLEVNKKMLETAERNLKVSGRIEELSERNLRVLGQNLRILGTIEDLSEATLDAVKSNGQILQSIADDLTPEPPLTTSVTNRFTIGDSIMDNALVFNVGQSSIDTITPLLADGTTSSGGVVSNVSFSFDDTSVSIVLNPDNTLTLTGVSASTGPVNGSVSCTVTDTDGAVSTWTKGFTVQTNGAPPPEQLTQSIANRFSVPTP